MESLPLAFRFPRAVISTALLLCCLCSFLLTVECPAESIGFSSGFQDVRPVCDAIEQCFAESGIRDHLRPLREGKVRGQNYSRSCGAFGNHLKQELRPDFSERYVAHFVDRDQVVATPARHHPPQLQLMLRLHQLIDQRGGCREANSSPLPTCRHAQASKKMRLPGSARARNIVPMGRSSSRFTTCGTPYTGKPYAYAERQNSREASTSFAIYPMGALAVSQRG